MTNGQPSGTQEAVTIDSTDSAATETNTNTVTDTKPTSADAIAAEAAAAESWVRDLFGAISGSIQVSRVPVDTAQLFATAGVDFNTVIRDSMSAVQGIAAGEVYELFNQDQLNYAKAVARRMQRVLQLPAGSTVDASYIYRKPYLKQRQLVQVVGGLNTDSRGQQYYVIHTGTLDPERPLDQPVWRTQDVAAKQWGEIRLYMQGNSLWRWHNGSREAVVLGSSSLVSNLLQQCLQSEHYARLQEIGANSPELKADEIRRSHEGQLVFWQAQHLAAQQRAALEAAKPAV